MRAAAIFEMMRKTVKSLCVQTGLSEDFLDILPTSEPNLLLLLLALRLLGANCDLVDLKPVPAVAPIDPYFYNVAFLAVFFPNPLFPYGTSSASI